MPAPQANLSTLFFPSQALSSRCREKASISVLSKPRVDGDHEQVGVSHFLECLEAVVGQVRLPLDTVTSFGFVVVQITFEQAIRDASSKPILFPSLIAIKNTSRWRGYKTKKCVKEQQREEPR